MTDASQGAGSPHERLSYSRGVLEKIRQSYDKLSRDELLDLLCYISKTYIVEQTIPFDLPLPERADEESSPEPTPEGVPEAVQDPELAPFRRFARLIEGLKKRTALPQLEGFAVEDGKAVLIVDNQKITFGERVTVEFVPTRTRARTDEPAAAPAPAAPTRPAPGAGPGAPFDAPPPRPARPAPPPPPARDTGRAEPRQGPIERPAAKAPGVPPKPEKKEGDLTDVEHIVERFRRLDLD